MLSGNRRTSPTRRTVVSPTPPGSSTPSTAAACRPTPWPGRSSSRRGSTRAMSPDDRTRAHFLFSLLNDALARSPTPCSTRWRSRALFDRRQRQRFAWRAPAARRPAAQQRHAATGQQAGLRGRPQPGHHARRRGVPQRDVRANPLQADEREAVRHTPAGGTAADQRVLHLRPQPGEELRPVLPEERPAGIHDQLGATRTRAIASGACPVMCRRWRTPPRM